MRYLALAFLAVLLGGVASAAASTTAGIPVRVDRSTVFGGSGPVPFRPDAHFELGVLVRNTSGFPLVVTGARVLAPARTLIHQIGTRFHPWNPPTCPPNVGGCPIYGFRMNPRPYRPKPFVVRPDKDVGVELDFVLGACAQIPGFNAAPLTRLRVTFRRPDGATGDRVLWLGRASLRMRTPNVKDCADPHSSLAVLGPHRYATSSRRTIPSSVGDVCQIRNGRLDFVSPKYRAARNRWERITLHVSRYRGRGTYDRGTATLIVSGRKAFRWHPPSALTVLTSTRRVVIATLGAGSQPSVAIRGTVRCRVATG